MNPVVKTFLLVSAAYLLGRPVPPLAMADDREVTNQDKDDCVVEESADEDYSRPERLANLSLLLKSRDSMK